MQLVPTWLESLLSTSFFNNCLSHQDSSRNECNMFCLDCEHDAFCFYCRSSRHKDHFVIQIRRSSYHDVVRVAEIEDVLDVSGVQTYVINSARVVFLNERPQPKTSTSKGGVSHVCETCARNLLDPFRFCSLGCKVEAIKKNGDANFNLTTKEEVEEEVKVEVEERSLESKKEEEEELPVASHQDLCGNRRSTSSNNSNSRRRRKGIPRRAPFAS